MIVQKDKKGDTYLICTRDKEGYHKSINLTHDECVELFNELWEAVILDEALAKYEIKKQLKREVECLKK